MFESRRKYLLGFPYKQVSNNLHFIIVWVLGVAFSLVFLLTENWRRTKKRVPISFLFI